MLLRSQRFLTRRLSSAPQALAQCDCFTLVNDDGSESQLCFLPADYAAICTTPASADEPSYAEASLQRIAWAAVALYGVGIPTLYAALLWRCRNELRHNTPSPLSTALAFLHDAYKPEVAFWATVDAARSVACAQRAP